MELLLLLCAGVILLCMVANRFSNRFGMPALLLFMALGMLFGSDGLLRISFDNYKVTERICAVALTFIMFYGGFCTKWKMARPVAGKAIALSSLGTSGHQLHGCGFRIFHSAFQKSGPEKRYFFDVGAGERQ